ncbi:MAG: GNAT family N-acetyltransferase [Alphaproteobacteria bacterium]|nr:GNAT family N-acetyltransferase [Alphaproteobacteria bacterium]
MSYQVFDQKDEFHERVEAIRRFNRLYTSRIGLLQQGHLDSPYSLTEARILYELGQKPFMTARDLCEVLGLDQGYVSRILTRFQKQGLIGKRVSGEDARAQLIALTKTGEKIFSTLDLRSHAVIAAMLQEKSATAQREIAQAAQTLERHFGGVQRSQAPIVIRPPQAGDLGWIVHRQAILYACEYGWRIEGVVAEIVAAFEKSADPARERCWIAERDGEILGAVFLAKDDCMTGRLRLLYVESAARGQGLGRQLVELCIGFAREAGYSKVKLWTHTVLASARKIYQATGFRLTDTYTHNEFGKEVLSENWELDLTAPAAD